jgi:hypothetical protein
MTDIKREDLPYFLLGFMDKSIYLESDGILDETIIELPVEGCVLVYNKYAEEKAINKKRNPLAYIPELNITLHSRCVLCGIDADGNLISLVPEQSKAAIKYLSL